MNLRKAIECAGGPPAAAKACGISLQAVHKWLAAGRLPRTEYTGETQYAEKIAAAAGGAFSSQELLECAVPGRALKVHQGMPS